MVDAVLTLAAALGKVPESEQEGLKPLCQMVVEQMMARLKAGVAVEDCTATLTLGGAWLVLAQLCLEGCVGDVESFTAGSLTIRKSQDMSPADRCRALQRQAEGVLAPYLKDTGFAFMGVRG